MGRTPARSVGLLVSGAVVFCVGACFARLFLRILPPPPVLDTAALALGGASIMFTIIRELEDESVTQKRASPSGGSQWQVHPHYIDMLAHTLQCQPDFVQQLVPVGSVDGMEEVLCGGQPVLPRDTSLPVAVECRGGYKLCRPGGAKGGADRRSGPADSGDAGGLVKPWKAPLWIPTGPV